VVLAALEPETQHFAGQNLRAAPGVLRRSFSSIGTRIALGALIPGGLLAFWWYLAEHGGLNTEIYASPRILFNLFAELWQAGIIQEHGIVSIRRVLIGFTIGSSIAVFLGVICGYFRFFEKLLDPSIQILRAMPTVALLPMFLIWFGFGEFSKVLLIVLGIIPRTYVITYTGIVNVDKKLLEVARVYNLTKFQTITQIVIPSAAPYIFNALRLASVSSFLLLIFAEAINPKEGFGFLAQQALFNIRVDYILLIAMIYAVLGLTVDTAVRLVEKALTPWNGKKGVR
jgi:sulfonate transport system permease protein